VSIGFYLLGRFTKPKLEPHIWLRQLEKWILKKCSDLQPATRQGFIQEKPCLFSTFHPAAEEVEIALPDPNHITVSANTSTAGPGYHIFLCDLLHRWTDDFSINWKRFGPDDDTCFGDEADYFFGRNQRSVYGHMEHWLKRLTGGFFDGTFDPDLKEIALCMPMNVRFEANSLAITQLGPRNRDWLFQMSNGSIDYREFFPWYKPGINADYHLGRALVHMWSDIRWRKSVDQNEAHLVQSVLSSLELAYRMDPTLQFPWNEWQELLVLSEKKVPNFLRQQATGAGHIGYRRRRVKTSLPGGWWIETEGSFSEFKPDSDGAVSSFDPPREIWFTAYSFSADDQNQAFHRMRDTALSEKHDLIHQNDSYISVADINKQTRDNGGYYLLKASSIGVLCRSILTLVFNSQVERDWAIGVWKSLKPPSPATKIP
jgi:hypothetical protein